MSKSLTPTALTAETFIRFDRLTKDYAIHASGEIIGYAPDYFTAEAKRTAYLAERLSHPIPDDEPLPNPLPGDENPPVRL